MTIPRYQECILGEEGNRDQMKEAAHGKDCYEE